MKASMLSSELEGAYHLDAELHCKFVYKTVWLDHYCEVQSLLDLTKVKLELGSSDK